MQVVESDVVTLYFFKM